MRDPTEVAANYRVLRRVEGSYELRGGSTSIDLKRGGAFLHLRTTPAAVHWEAEQGIEPYYAVRCLVTDLTIGHRGDEGWSSALVDNCFFVIDGENLRYVPLSELTVLSEGQFRIRRARLAAESGKTTPDGTSQEDDADYSLAEANITHCSALPEHGIADSLESEIGLEDRHFSKLVEGCTNGRISAVRLRGIGGALSSSFEYGEKRDLILLSGEEIAVSIDYLSFEYRV